jgi:hypothetical protein
MGKSNKHTPHCSQSCPRHARGSAPSPGIGRTSHMQQFETRTGRLFLRACFAVTHSLSLKTLLSLFFPIPGGRTCMGLPGLPQNLFPNCSMWAVYGERGESACFSRNGHIWSQLCDDRSQHPPVSYSPRSSHTFTAQRPRRSGDRLSRRAHSAH